MKRPERRVFVYQDCTYPYELHLGGVKRINVRVRPDGSIRVSAPRAIARRRIDAFLISCGDKIASAVSRVRQRRTDQAPTMTKAELSAQRERLLSIIKECHRDVVLPRFEALPYALTDQQWQFIKTPAAIRIRDMKTRWGSCNFGKGTLNFNLRLIDQPVSCIEYVVMHEFAHFVHPNHSPDYHALMTALLPDWKQRKARLNS